MIPFLLVLAVLEPVSLDGITVESAHARCGRPVAASFLIAKPGFGHSPVRTWWASAQRRIWDGVRREGYVLWWTPR